MGTRAESPGSLFGFAPPPNRLERQRHIRALGAVWWRAIGIALVLGLVIHLAFVNLLNVFLPPGVLSGPELFNG